MAELHWRSLRILALGAMVAALSEAAHAQNQLVNPDFDQGIDGWSAPRGTLTWQPDEDVDGCEGSGAARIADPELVDGVRTLEFVSDGSCADVAPDQVFAYYIRMFPVVSGAHTDILLLTYTDDACGAGEAEAPLVGYNALPSIWLNLMIGTTIQAPVESARVLIRSTDPELTTLETLFDRIYFGDAEPIHRDDFETGTPCRWSSVVG